MTVHSTALRRREREREYVYTCVLPRRRELAVRMVVFNIQFKPIPNRQTNKQTEDEMDGWSEGVCDR
jgi:hypothetical protein